MKSSGKFVFFPTPLVLAGTFASCRGLPGCFKTDLSTPYSTIYPQPTPLFILPSQISLHQHPSETKPWQPMNHINTSFFRSERTPLSSSPPSPKPSFFQTRVFICKKTCIFFDETCRSALDVQDFFFLYLTNISFFCHAYSASCPRLCCSSPLRSPI